MVNAEQGERANASLYGHYQLSRPSDIRLLHVHPSTDPDGPLTCNLRVVDLDARPAPEYAAISYHWGEAVFDQLIVIGDATFTTTRNAYAALRRGRRTGWQFFWIDQLCINQNDFAEKSQQVPLMRQIYSVALEVFIWLGESFPGIDESKAISLIADRAVWQHVQKQGLHAKPGNEVHIKAKRGEGGLQFRWKLIRTPDEALQPSDGADWIAYGSVLARPWYSRSWIVQEVAGRERTRVLCGDRFEIPMFILHEANWKDYNAVSGEPANSLWRWANPNRWPEGISPLTSMQYLRELAVAPDGSSHLNYLRALDAGRARGCTNLRDHIYAVHGLCDVPKTLPVPNYHASVEEVYQNFAEHYIHTGNGWDMVRRAGLCWQARPLPSWCPDWSGNQGPVMLNDEYNPMLDLSLQPCGDVRPSVIKLGPGNNQISTRGYVFDMIIHAAPVFSRQAHPGDDDFTGWMQPSLKLLPHCHHYGDERDALEAFVKLCFGPFRPNDVYQQVEGRWRDLVRAKPFDPQKFKEFFGVVERDASDIDAARSAQLKNADRAANVIGEVWEDWVMVDTRVMNRRRLCATAGGYLATVPAQAEPGDCLVSFGSGLPNLVLRSKSNTQVYTLIGDALVVPQTGENLVWKDSQVAEVILE